MRSFFWSALTRTQRIVFVGVFLAVYVSVCIHAYRVSMYHDTKARDSIHGDSYSDKNTHSAIRYFQDYGFLKTAFLPAHGYPGGHDESIVGVYTHYPALPDVLHGLYSKGIDSTDEFLLRLFPITLSVVLFLLIFQTLYRLLGSRNSAFFISGILLVCSNYFVFWADNLHKHMYEELFKWAFLYLMYEYYQQKTPNMWLFVGAYIVFVAVTNISFEPVTFLAIVTVGLHYIYRRSIVSIETVLMATAPFVGFGLHMYQNYLYMGSIQAVYEDMHASVTLRTTGSEHVQNEIKRVLTFTDYVWIPMNWIQRMERFFLIPGFAFVIISTLCVQYWKKHDKIVFQLFWVMLAAGISWSLAMSQHFVVHIFTTKHLGILFGIVAGQGVLLYVDRLKKALQSGTVVHKIVFFGIGVYVLIMAISQQLYDYVRYIWFYSGV